MRISIGFAIASILSFAVPAIGAISPDVPRTIASAIRAREEVLIFYHGEWRQVAPHVLGVDHRGQLLMNGWQSRASVRSGRAGGWRLFRVREILGAERTGQRFQTAPGYNPPGRFFREIVAMVPR